MSARRKAERRLEIAAVRENARQAVVEGKSRSSCPYKYCDQYQWQNAFDAWTVYYAREEEVADLDPIQVVRDLLEHAVYDREKNDECIDAVAAAERYLEEHS